MPRLPFDLTRRDLICVPRNSSGLRVKIGGGSNVRREDGGGDEGVRGGGDPARDGGDDGARAGRDEGAWGGEGVPDSAKIARRRASVSGPPFPPLSPVLLGPLGEAMSQSIDT